MIPSCLRGLILSSFLFLGWAAGTAGAPNGTVEPSPPPPEEPDVSSHDDMLFQSELNLSDADAAVYGQLWTEVCVCKIADSSMRYALWVVVACIVADTTLIECWNGDTITQLGQTC